VGKPVRRTSALWETPLRQGGSPRNSRGKALRTPTQKNWEDAPTKGTEGLGVQNEPAWTRRSGDRLNMELGANGRNGAARGDTARFGNWGADGSVADPVMIFAERYPTRNAKSVIVLRAQFAGSMGAPWAAGSPGPRLEGKDNAGGPGWGCGK